MRYFYARWFYFSWTVWHFGISFNSHQQCKLLGLKLTHIFIIDEAVRLFYVFLDYGLLYSKKKKKKTPVAPNEHLQSLFLPSNRPTCKDVALLFMEDKEGAENWVVITFKKQTCVHFAWKVTKIINYQTVSSFSPYWLISCSEYRIVF